MMEMFRLCSFLLWTMSPFREELIFHAALQEQDISQFSQGWKRCVRIKLKEQIRLENTAASRSLPCVYYHASF